MITVDICPEGELVSDFKVEEFVRDLVSRAELSDYECFYANFHVMGLLRAELVENPELQKHFKFKVCGEEVHFDKNMRSEDAWLDISMDVSCRILNQEMINYTKEKERLKVALPPALDQVLLEFPNKDDKIKALKRLRELTNCGLKAGHDALIERYEPGA